VRKLVSSEASEASARYSAVGAILREKPQPSAASKQVRDFRSRRPPQPSCASIFCLNQPTLLNRRQIAR